MVSSHNLEERGPPDMPRLTDAILDCAVYLYPSERAARRGEATGGSGFLIGIPLGEAVRAEEYPEVTRRLLTRRPGILLVT